MTLVFATNNKHKLEEVQSILGKDFIIKSLLDCNCTEDIPETGKTLEENSLIKAKYVADNYNCNCFADDTGLEVEALNGEPGVYSARYDETTDHDSSANMRKLLTNMHGITNRKARFRTVITLIIKGEVHKFEGVVEGRITIEKHGESGFGYDPIFLPDGYSKTFGEMTGNEKNAISHRARATEKLAQYLLNCKRQ